MNSELLNLDGQVKWFNQLRGYGFVHVLSLNQDAYLHASVCPDGIALMEGSQIKVDLEKSEKGFQVVKLELV